MNGSKVHATLFPRAAVSAVERTTPESQAEERKICKSLLKMYRITYLEHPQGVADRQPPHLADIRFGRQSDRNLFPEYSTLDPAQDYGTSKNHEEEDENGRIPGFVMMDKQLPRRARRSPDCVPEYKPNYGLVLPRVLTSMVLRRNRRCELLKRAKEERNKGAGTDAAAHPLEKEEAGEQVLRLVTTRGGEFYNTCVCVLL